MVYGFTPDGRYIVVVYEEIDDHTLYPVTVYTIGTRLLCFAISGVHVILLGPNPSSG